MVPQWGQGWVGVKDVGAELDLQWGGTLEGDGTLQGALLCQDEEGESVLVCC